MSVLVFLENNESDLLRGPLGVLGMAAGLGQGEVAAVLVGDDTISGLVPDVGKFGATTVYLAGGEGLDAPLPQPRVDVLERIVEEHGYDTVLFSNSVLASDVAAGLAARFDAGLNWDLVDLVQREGALIGTRLIFQDSVQVDVGWRSPRRIALFRPGAFEPVTGSAGGPEVERITVQLHDHSGRVALESHRGASSEGPSFDDAQVIIAGGMGLGRPENFSLAEDLAAVLGGVVGATRAAVYAGWYPRSAQIGQTGRTVSPDLYFALGISGAVQHKVGMQSSKTVVAINKDPNAPIFEVSDLAVVGDVEEIVPRLTELLRQRAGR
jgi:electron transfer flavoprotein alpha subunit